MTQYIPAALRQAFERDIWPLGRLRGARFPAVSNYCDVDLELTPKLADIEADTSNIAALRTIRGWDGSYWCFYESSRGASPRPLPWIDLDKAICIGGGADYGDDMWLVLDLRGSLDDPPVLYNLFAANVPPADSRVTGESATTAGIQWRLAAPTLTEFLAQARG